MEELTLRLQKTRSFLTRVDQLSQFNGYGRFRRKFVAELKFLEDLKSKDHELVERHLRSSNLPFLEAVLKIAEKVEVENVFAKYTFPDEHGREKQVTVDLVTKDEKQWIKVIARNPEALHRTWLGQGQYGTKDICDVGKEFVSARQEVCMDPDATMIMFHFENGVLEHMADGLKQVGIIVTGEILTEDRKERKSIPLVASNLVNLYTAVDEPSIARVNLDITALVAMISSVTNGGCHYHFQDKIINEQACEERLNPVLPQIESFIEGKELYVCRTAYNDFNSILTTVGGETEKDRAHKLLSKVRLVEDQMSSRAESLVESGRVRRRSKTIFGTGDTLKATTLTANSSFVRASINQGVKFRVFFHASRALTEQKEPLEKVNQCLNTLIS